MARSGMANLILRMRQMCNAGTADYTITGTTPQTFWSDDQLQAKLDQHRQDFYRESLAVQATQDDGGTARYQDYYSCYRNLEEAASGAAVWQVENSAGSAIGTASYTPNYDAGHIYFAADQGGTAYYLSGRAYDMERTAADVWEVKAAQVADRYDVTTDNHSLKRSQLYQMYMASAKQYRRQARPRTVQMIREDYE